MGVVNRRVDAANMVRFQPTDFCDHSLPGVDCSQHCACTVSEREQFGTAKSRGVIKQLSNTWVCLVAL